MRTGRSVHLGRLPVVAAILVLVPAAAAVRAGAAPGGAVAAATPGSTVFTIDHPPDAMPGAHTADEPSIGVDWHTGAVMYESLLHTFRVTFDGAGTATWTDVSAPLTDKQSLDPILFTDPVTGRTIVSQLAAGCSISELSDDDGATWLPDEGCGPPAGIDHPTVGGGPFAPPAAATVYPHAVYYCSHAQAAALCSLSLDGGLTYGPGVVTYTQQQCGGLHGHIRVAPDGTAVLPNQNCGAAPTLTSVSGQFTHQAAVVSTDAGATWAVHVIPGSAMTLRSDPSVAADAAGRLYFGFEQAVDSRSNEQVGGRAMISMSDDDGTTWSTPVDVGAPFGIRNVTFPAVIAGDAGRAAYAFLGSPSGGDPEQQSFQGLWYLYVALTDDGGASWRVMNLTPGDPVERGCTYLAGTGDCPNPAKRNLYDFMDITADSHGRVLVGFSDGCTGTCVTEQHRPCADKACDKGPTASTDHLASIARQQCGEGLVAHDDTELACTSAAPAVSNPTAASSGSVLASSAGPSPGTAPGLANTAAPAEGGGGAAATVLAATLVGLRRRRRAASRGVTASPAGRRR